MMENETANFYLRWSVVILIGSLALNGIGYLLISFHIQSLKKEIANASSMSLQTSPPPFNVLSATTGSASITNELIGIKNELVRLRAEQRDINRILELPVTPREIVNIFSNYKASTESAKP